MTVSEKAREKLDETTKEIKETIDGLKREVAGLTEKIKDKLKGASEDIRRAAEDLAGEAKNLSDRVRDLVPGAKKGGGLPARAGGPPAVHPDLWWERFYELRRATNRIFDDFLRDLRFFGAPMRNPWEWELGPPASAWPPADLIETDEEVVLKVELPGVKEDRLEVSLSEGRLSIRGEKLEEEEWKERGTHYLERSYGLFHRTFSLPCEVDEDRASATFKAGVLTVRLPKTEAARLRMKRIPVQTG